MNGFRMDVRELERSLSRLNDMRAVAMRLDTSAHRLENYMKLNRPWHDQTGHARQRLTGSVEPKRDGYRIRLAHGVSYGANLEFGHNKRYAIIFPTIERKGPEVIQSFRNLMEALDRG